MVLLLYFRYIEEFLKSKYILKEIGNVNTVEYLALRLSCDVSVVSEMIKKHPKLRQVNLYKLKQMLDYLLIGEFYSLTFILPFSLAYFIFVPHARKKCQSRACYKVAAVAL